jgi:hypothetical protein
MLLILLSVTAAAAAPAVEASFFKAEEVEPPDLDPGRAEEVEL